MKKIMNIAAIATILLAFAACQKDSTSVSNSSQDESTLKKKAVTRPFKGHDTGTIAVVYSEDNECYPNFSQIQFTGTGTGTHVGNHTIESFVCVNQEFGLEGTFYGIWTGANGDQIFFTQPDPTVFTLDEFGNVTGNFDIIGGTGKFENATGHFNTYGVDDFVNMTFEIYSDGYIMY